MPFASRGRSLALRFFLLVLVCSLTTTSPGEAQVLKRGMRGTEVLALQEVLIELGHTLVPDGVFGGQTETLIKEIQKAVGLKSDGIVGRQTLDVLSQLRNSVVSYTVKQGDNLTKLAQRYDTTVADISSYNDLKNPDRLLPGQILYIPTTSLAVLSRSFSKRVKLQWPVKGTITSGYGYRIHPVVKTRHFHGGIDIASPEGAQVKASATGKVIKVGSLGNYGLAVVLDHGGGFSTWYGHCSKLLVRLGETVKQGQTIALVGHTGLATGSHLDFRIKIGGQTLDPLEWLP